MTIHTVDDAQRKAARVAGLAYLITFATVVYVNFGIHNRLIVAGDPGQQLGISWLTKDCFVSAS